MTLKIEKKQPMGVSMVEKGGTQTIKEEPVGEPVVSPSMGIKKVGDIMEAVPYANVGMKVGKTMNLGNYESVRVDVSLYVPCENDDEVINQTFDLVSNWCDLKMEGIIEEYEEFIKANK